MHVATQVEIDNAGFDLEEHIKKNLIDQVWAKYSVEGFSLEKELQEWFNFANTNPGTRREMSDFVAWVNKKYTGLMLC